MSKCFKYRKQFVLLCTGYDISTSENIRVSRYYTIMLLFLLLLLSVKMTLKVMQTRFFMGFSLI